MYNKDPDKIKIIYKIDKNEIKDNKITIFGQKFVENYRDICKIVVEGKSYELTEFFNLENLSQTNDTLEIELKNIRYLTNLRMMFPDVNYCLLCPIFQNGILLMSII